MSFVDEIKKWVTIFSPALTAIPGVGPVMPFVNIAFHAIGEAEDVFGPGKGSEKLEHAMNAAADAINIYNAAAGKNFNTSGMMDALKEMINAGVKFCNAMGVFKKS